MKKDYRAASVLIGITAAALGAGIAIGTLSGCKVPQKKGVVMTKIIEVSEAPTYMIWVQGDDIRSYEVSKEEYDMYKIGDEYHDMRM